MLVLVSGLCSPCSSAGVNDLMESVSWTYTRRVPVFYVGGEFETSGISGGGRLGDPTVQIPTKDETITARDPAHFKFPAHVKNEHPSYMRPLVFSHQETHSIRSLTPAMYQNTCINAIMERDLGKFLYHFAGIHWGAKTRAMASQVYFASCDNHEFSFANDSATSTLAGGHLANALSSVPMAMNEYEDDAVALVATICFFHYMNSERYGLGQNGYG